MTAPKRTPADDVDLRRAARILRAWGYPASAKHIRAIADQITDALDSPVPDQKEASNA